MPPPRTGERLGAIKSAGNFYAGCALFDPAAERWFREEVWRARRPPPPPGASWPGPRVWGDLRRAGAFVGLLPFCAVAPALRAYATEMPASR